MSERVARASSPPARGAPRRAAAAWSCPLEAVGRGMAQASMYVRVKRQKTTIFVLTGLQDSVLELKAKLQQHVDDKACAPPRPGRAPAQRRASARTSWGGRAACRSRPT